MKSAVELVGDCMNNSEWMSTTMDSQLTMLAPMLHYEQLLMLNSLSL